MNFSNISAAVNFTDVLTAMGVVAVAIAGVALAAKGAGMLIGFLRRA